MTAFSAPRSQATSLTSGSRKLPHQFCRGLAIPNQLDVSERAARAGMIAEFSLCRVGHQRITILSVTRASHPA